MENEAEENFSKMIKAVNPLSNDQKVFLDLGQEGKAIPIDATNTGIYEYNITKPITITKSGSYVEDDDSCLTTTITTNELCDSNSVLSVAGANNSEDIQTEDSKTDVLANKDSKEKLEEQSAFDIHPINIDTGAEELVQSAQSTSKSGRRSSANHEVGSRQLKYNQIGVYWKDKESRVYARFTWATRKYSKSFYVGPNKPYATVRDAEKAAIRFLLINSPLHRRSHLKHFRFSESDEEGEEPYVGSQALKEARRTKGIMLHFPAPESDDEVWSHYNTSNINPATLYGEIIKKMDNSEGNAAGITSPITSAREYVTAKHKQNTNTNQNESKFSASLPVNSTIGENVSSDDLFLALMANQIESDRLVERQTTGTYMNPSASSTTVSSKRFKPNSKTETLDSSELNFFPTNSNQLGSAFMDQSSSTTSTNPFVGMDYNTLVALQHAQMANYYLQQQVAYAAAANLAISSNTSGNYANAAIRTNPFIIPQYCLAPVTGLESNKSEESEVDKLQGVTLNVGGLKGSTQSNASNSVKNIAESTLDQYGAIMPGQETKAMPSSNITICGTNIPSNYHTDYMAVMAAAYSGWYSPYGYTMPFMGSYTPMMPSIIPNPNVLGSQFHNNISLSTNTTNAGQVQSSSVNNAVRLQKQVNNNVNSIESLVNTRVEKELQSQGTSEQENKQVP
ncbi:uncharacterized protein cubi_01314 [Cryptosporidium ubiquitum]|uniref:Uncharacterized protein n=1 Tax=Cryptosporidium ubiquitum TaxID=857276 RepID=A0A1J4MFA2_9CRYT|nr:uncharacterized protein cubi_01314 [Cryptosporidium ubiquitum]OII71700.1 hypothetical protein cubi_01314 [Cryptosporidium ubiquitum]